MCLRKFKFLKFFTNFLIINIITRCFLQDFQMYITQYFTWGLDTYTTKNVYFFTDMYSVIR